MQYKKEKLQKQIKQKLKQPKYRKPNGKVNISKICEDLKIHRDIFYRYQENTEIKK